MSKRTCNGQKMTLSRYIHYPLVFLFYLLVARVGGFFTVQGVTTWYPEISKPVYTPPGNFIGIMWAILYILSAISLILFINGARGKIRFWPVIGLYILNGLFNASWSYLFFVKHQIGAALIDALLIWITVAILVISVWSSSRIGSILLLPYLAWVSFATYLNYMIYILN